MTYHLIQVHWTKPPLMPRVVGASLTQFHVEVDKPRSLGAVRSTKNYCYLTREKLTSGPDVLFHEHLLVSWYVPSPGHRPALSSSSRAQIDRAHCDSMWLVGQPVRWRVDSSAFATSPEACASAFRVSFAAPDAECIWPRRPPSSFNQLATPESANLDSVSAGSFLCTCGLSQENWMPEYQSRGSSTFIPTVNRARVRLLARCIKQRVILARFGARQ
jgi:hypothetical protein